jgi:ATP synthase F1 complex assembly factor 2
MKRVKRFYDTVDIRRCASGSYELLLSGKSLRTPLGSNMHLANEAIASAAATEWQVQEEYVIPNTMPINTVVMTHIDIDSKIDRLEKINQIDRFFQTDTIRFPDVQRDSKLSRLQKEKWSPVLRYFDSRGIMISQSNGGFDIPEGTDKEITNIHSNIVDGYDSLKLTMLETASKYLKSGTIGVGLIEGVLSPVQAFEAAYVEEIAQRHEWGLVEGEHDLNDAETLLWLHGIYILGKLVRL